MKCLVSAALLAGCVPRVSVGMLGSPGVIQYGIQSFLLVLHLPELLCQLSDLQELFCLVLMNPGSFQFRPVCVSLFPHTFVECLWGFSTALKYAKDPFLFLSELRPVKDSRSGEIWVSAKKNNTEQAHRLMQS